MCGIFAYLNYNVGRERSYILEVLLNGLRRLEYRGYDSAGIAIDSDMRLMMQDKPYDTASPQVFRQEGKIENLVTSVYSGLFLAPFCIFIFLSCIFLFWSCILSACSCTQ